ncbi:MAG: capsular biosynthesis protein, partial [Clostridia bacterium]|nr:capsular biosynthesis protein [Clostridia bacterium]
HLLPGVDDGAKDVDMSLELLTQERTQGVTNIIFTSHFRPDREDLHAFLKKRNKAFGTLMDAVQSEGSFNFSYKLGAEVYFSPTLTELDVESLCFTRSPFLLLEFSFTREPAFLDRVLFDLQTRGVRPVIAHVERYEWLKDRPDILHSWVSSGIILQSNASALLKGGESERYISKLIDHNMVKVLSSDAHHPERRPANLGSGLMYVSQNLGQEKARELLQNGNRIFRGEDVIDNPPILPKRRFGKWV